MTSLLRTWIRDFDDLPPINWLLRTEQPNGWARIHFFDGHRWPRSKEDETIVRRLAYDIISIVGSSSQFSICAPEWGLDFTKLPFRFSFFRRPGVWTHELLDLDDDGSQVGLFGATLSHEDLDDVVDLFFTAADNRGQFTLHFTDTHIAVSPYDGGVDFAFCLRADTAEIRRELESRIGINQNL